MREHEAQRAFVRTHQFWNHGFEVVAICTQAVHPDDAAGRVTPGFDLDGFKQCGHGRMGISQTRAAVYGVGAGA